LYVFCVCFHHRVFGAITVASPFNHRIALVRPGAIRVRSILHAPGLLPYAGRTFRGLSHITDWFPTIMNIATRSRWGGVPISGLDIDGVDLWERILTVDSSDENYKSPRTTLVMNYNEDGEGVILMASNRDGKLYKLMIGQYTGTTEQPAEVPYDTGLHNHSCTSPVPTPFPSYSTPLPSTFPSYAPTPHPSMLPSPTSCEDTADGDVADAGGRGCAAYLGHPNRCGRQDDDDFSASDVCCSCGGGA
jgi:hypothetical protein